MINRASHDLGARRFRWRGAKIIAFLLFFGALLWLGQAGQRKARAQAKVLELFTLAEQVQGPSPGAIQPDALQILKALAERWDRELSTARLNARDEARFQLSKAVVALAEQRFGDAAAILSNSGSDLPDEELRERLLRAKAGALHGSRQWEEALKLYQELGRKNPVSTRALADAAECLEGLARSAEAEAERAKLAALCESRGMQLVALGDHERALRQFERAGEAWSRISGPDSLVGANLGRAHHHCGVVLLLQGKPDAAAERFGRAIKVISEMPEASSALTDAYLNRASALLLGFKPEGALDDFQRALTRADGLERTALAGVHQGVGSAYLLQGKAELAAASFNHALEILEADSSDLTRYPVAVARHALANALLAQGKLQEAMASVENSIALLSTLSGALAIKELALAINSRGVAYRARRDLSNASSDFSKTIELLGSIENAEPRKDPAGGLSAVVEVKLDIVMSFTENAIDVLTRPRLELPGADLEYSVGLAIAHKNRAYASLARRDPAGAIHDFDRSIATFARLVEREGQKDLAPQLARVLAPLAFILASHADEAIRDPARALSLAMKACELTEWRAFPALEALAAATAETGNFTEAARFQERAALLAPAGAQARLRARVELYQAGKPFRMPAQ